MKDHSGAWVVKCICGNEYGKDAGAIYRFRFMLIENEGEFVSEANDFDDNIVAMPSKVRGFIHKNTFLSFVQEYKDQWCYDPSGEIHILKDRPYEIHFTGSYDETNDTFRGNWELEPGKPSSGSGLFIMEKE